MPRDALNAVLADSPPTAVVSTWDNTVLYMNDAWHTLTPETVEEDAAPDLPIYRDPGPPFWCGGHGAWIIWSSLDRVKNYPPAKIGTAIFGQPDQPIVAVGDHKLLHEHAMFTLDLNEMIAQNKMALEAIKAAYRTSRKYAEEARATMRWSQQQNLRCHEVVNIVDLALRRASL